MHLSWTELIGLTPSIGLGLQNLTVRAVDQTSGESFTDAAVLHVHDGDRVEPLSSLTSEFYQRPPKDPVIEVSKLSGSLQVDLAVTGGRDLQYRLELTGPGGFSYSEIKDTPTFQFEPGEPGRYSGWASARVVGQTSDASSRMTFLVGPPDFAHADENGRVGFADFLALASNFGRVDAAFADGDFNGDNKVDFTDLRLLIENFGRIIL